MRGSSDSLFSCSSVLSYRQSQNKIDFLKQTQDNFLTTAASLTRIPLCKTCEGSERVQLQQSKKTSKRIYYTINIIVLIFMIHWVVLAQIPIKKNRNSQKSQNLPSTDSHQTWSVCADSKEEWLRVRRAKSILILFYFFGFFFFEIVAFCVWEHNSTKVDSITAKNILQQEWFYKNPKKTRKIYLMRKDSRGQEKE